MVELEEGHIQEEEEEEDVCRNSLKKRARTGAAKYSSKFNSAWSTEWPFIKPGTTQHHFWCDICRCELDCGHQGKADVQRHIARDCHIKKQKCLQSAQRIDNFVFSRTDELNLETQVISIKIHARAKHRLTCNFRC